MSAAEQPGGLPFAGEIIDWHAHPSRREQFSDENLAAVLTAWSRAAAGVECLQVHTVCESPGCDVAMCEDDCGLVGSFGCLHGRDLCGEHVTDCAECRADLRAEAGSDW